MTLTHKIIFIVFVLLWLGLSYIMIDLAGFYLVNILWAIVAGGLILIPLWKRWRKND